MLYRVKQFILGILSYFESDNVDFINKYLNKKEKNLFMKLSKPDRIHSFRVCKDAILIGKDYDTVDEFKIAKCALLHDIGKVEISLNIIEKGVVVIINKVTNGSFLKYNKYSRMTKYYNHPAIGKELLEKINFEDKEILYCIENHHKNLDEIEENLYLKILNICDSKN
ncbi:HD domain-containing protein [Clostridium botulinum]|uniref:HD domain-containing protein n=1 Tax=Clostridium botulinum TaxID=1491 RepID=A0A0M1LUZ5_CLOBO|nr:HD domain-containing protein [Clostridium botulinum]EES48410.1 HD domain protein [Clostridium botulinum E1 str. 'BoNT E Beluga']KAI3346226.1 HD domain-containing protein [Clostridium botulinum]KOM88235.1 phosphohydrolase [Clostridium botulinum]KOR61240.1 phosphohydrolase [Clostridium botulinum]MBN1047142.1 HD domain-containing protein [Clostridium botulinum]